MAKKRKKKHGHCSWSCQRSLPNERFSGRSHGRHLCKQCSRLGKRRAAATLTAAPKIGVLPGIEDLVEHLDRLGQEDFARLEPEVAGHRPAVRGIAFGRHRLEIRSEHERATKPWMVHRAPGGMTRIVVCSGEPSGDAMVQELLPALRDLFGNRLQLRALTSSPVEGVEEEEVLCPAPEPMLGVSLGGVRRWRAVLQDVWRILEAEPPDLFIAIAHHGFNLVLAAELKALAGAKTRTLMVAPPEVWAWDVRSWLRPVGLVLRWLAPRRQSVPFVLGIMANRGRSTVRLFDGIACLMEPNLQAYLRLVRKNETGSLVTKVGHPFARYADPAVQERVRGAAQALRATLVSSPEDLLVGIFPGSREAEVDHLLPTMLDAMGRLRGCFGDRLKLVVTASDERRAAQIRRVLDEPARRISAAPIPHVTGRAEATMGAADFGLSCSGTVTLLAASLGLPSVVIYDRGWSPTRTLLTQLLLRRGRVSAERGAEPVDFALPSAIVGERVFPELSMRQCKPQAVAASLESLIDDEGSRERIRQHQQRLLGLLQPSPPTAGYGTAADTPMQRVAQVGLQLVAGSAGRA